MSPELCKWLEWDSGFFGFKIARVTADRLTASDMLSVLKWCGNNGVDCLYFLGASDDAYTIRQLEDNHFRFVDVRLTYERLLVDSLIIASKSFSGTVRQSTPEDIPVLKSIARTAYHDTRFYFDPHFDPRLCDALYETWVENSCRGYADSTLVAELGGEVVAYVTCHRLDPENGQIGLVGVSSNAQNMGIGQHIVRESIQWFIDQNLKRVSVVTQARNWRAQRLYQRCGFLIKTTQLWYHRWFVPEITE